MSTADPQSLDELFKPTPHPCAPWPFTPAQVRQLAAQDDTRAELAQFWRERERKIILASEERGEPYTYGFRLPHWSEVTQAMADKILFIILLGGNRSAKSECCGLYTVQAAVENANTNIVCGAENESASIETQQKLIWKYLPNHIKALNGKRDPKHRFKVNYSLAGGFTDRKLVLPNGSKITFKTYNQEPTEELEGQEFGHTEKLVVGAWMDENLPNNWMEVLTRRLRFRAAHLLWSFTPVRGMTPTIRNAVGTAKTLKSRRAELLSVERVHVPGCAPGEMPFVQEPVLSRGRVIYFFTEFNPFGAGGRSYYESVKEDCAGKPEDYIKKIAYGYTEDTQSRLFYAYGAHNLCDPADVPESGTNYMLVDPAGARNWATIWVRVVSGRPARLYIYRDWPDARRFGAWAEMDSNGKHPDGVAGPAQRPTVSGYLGYKRLWLREEAVRVPLALLDTAGKEISREEIEKHVAQLKDPHHRWLVREALRNGVPLAELRERIHERYMDPRAGRDQKITEKGGTCIIDEMAKANLDERTKEMVAPPFIFLPARGISQDAGYTEVNNLLALPNPLEPVTRLVNEPRLYVSRACEQVIWTLTNYTGEGGDDGAGKDFADLLRYGATADLRNVETGRKEWIQPGGY